MHASQQQGRISAADEPWHGIPPILSWQLLAESIALPALVCLTVFLLQWRYGFNWADEGWLWYGSQRTAAGQIPIRDFFSYDPGRYYWSALFFKLLGGNGLFDQIAANLAFGAIGLAAIYFTMAKSGLGRILRIAVLLILGIVIGFPRHKTYEQALSLICAGGIAFVMARPDVRLRWFLYGTLTGLAAFVGRNSGLYFLVAGLLLLVLLKIKRVQFAPGRALAFATCGILIGYSPMLFMIAFVHGYASAFYQAVLFSTHSQLGLAIPFPWRVHVRGLPQMDALQVRAVSVLCLAAPGTYLVAIWSWIRKHSDRALGLACAASLAGLPFLHHAFDRADFSHIAQGVAPFVIAVAACSVYLYQTSRLRWAFLAFAATALLVTTCWLPMEPLVQHLRTKAHNPESVRQVEINGREFEVPAEQAQVMSAVKIAFENCGAGEGRFFEAPYYPGLYAFLNTRAPFGETFSLWPRSDALQQREIAALQRQHTALILLNSEATMDSRDDLRLPRTNPELFAFIVSQYRQSEMKLPDRFELYYSPAECKSAP